MVDRSEVGLLLYRKKRRAFSVVKEVDTLGDGFTNGG
jgi:hypothetical protein